MLPRFARSRFGRGSVLVGERQVSDMEWRSEKSKEMFFFMLHRQEAVSKEEIFAALWPDLPESKCNSNFHSSLYRLRRALFHECVVRDANGGYALNPKGVFDVRRRAVQPGDARGRRRAGRRGRARRSSRKRSRRTRARSSSSTYSEWAEPMRRELEDRYIEALNELGARRLRDGHFEEALQLFKALEAVDTYSEAAAYGIMRATLPSTTGRPRRGTTGGSVSC